jgi:glycosyltransferase involved in cell wall biosynthesis
VVCPWLEDLVKNLDPDKTVYLIENPPVCESADENTERRAFELRHKYGLEEEQLVVYTGTLEINQGMDIVLSAIPTVVKEISRIRFVLVGGEPHQVETLRSGAKELDIEQWILLTGQRPTNEMPAFMYMADILISPRKFGQNTPLKIYSYLQSGKPIVATDLETHTQVLDSSIACLVNPDPEDFARGLLRVLRDPEYAHQLGQAAKERLELKYSWTQYMDNMRTFCDHVTMHIQRKS